MNNRLYRALSIFFVFISQQSFAYNGWIDVTARYLTNPSFDNNLNTGWTYTSNANSQTVRCEAMEFWNGTFNIYQRISLPAGHYRLSVSSFYRCQDNNAGYRNYTSGKENVTGQMYAGSTSKKLASVYSWSSTTDFASGTWTPSGNIYFPNTMESATAAFGYGAYSNSMEFDHAGGSISIGLSNDYFIQSNWCIFDNFKLEYYGEITPVSEIKLSQSSISLIAGESVALTATLIPDNATITKINWSSSNTGVANVDADGNVTAAETGTAIITASATDASGVVATATVNVEHNYATASSLIVNEIMAANVDQFVSPAFNFDGWIEVYNPSEKAVEAGNLFISNEKENLRKWQTPISIGIIPAKGYKLIWFDSNNVNAGNAPFKLDVDGGVIYISNTSGDIIAQVNYPEAMERVSYARTADGGDTWGYTSEPTPGSSNITSEYASEQLDAPVVDIPSQLFVGSLDVNVNIPDGTTLRYTTDGSLPTPDNGMTSTTGQFKVNSTACYRFRLFEDGKLASRVTTRSYIYKDKEYNLPVISVIGDSTFLYGDSLGVMVMGVNGIPGNGKGSPCNWNMDWSRPVNMSYITKDGEMAVNKDVDLEMAGGWSRAFEPHSFKLKGNKEYGGDKNYSYPFFTAKPYIRNRTLQIRNGGNDYVCRFKDPALETIMQTSGINIDLQSYQPVHEFVNGKYIGVLNMREPNNKHYVYANYGWDDDEIDQFEMNPDSAFVQKEGTADAYNTLYDISSGAANSNTFAEIKKLVDIDEFANYMAAMLYLGTTDWPQNNVKGFRNINDGKFRFVSMDLDFAFSSNDAFNFFESKQNYTFDVLYNGLPRVNQEIKLVTIFMNLLKNNEFRKKFIDTYSIMGGSVFEPSRCNVILDSLYNVASAEMALNDESPKSTYIDLKDKINSWPEVAVSAIKNYDRMALSGVTSRKGSIYCNADGASVFINDIEVPAGKFDGTLFAPVTIKAQAPAGYTFAGWLKTSDSFTTVFPKADTWSYYDKGSLDGNEWFSQSYTASWSQGKAPLGYGKTGLATTLYYGSNTSNKYPTYYLRKEFNLDGNPGTSSLFKLNYTVDDGFIVYVNGNRAGSYNASSEGFSEYSDSYAQGNPDSGSMTLDAKYFRKGGNIIAIELKNTNGTSSDVYFDAELLTNMNVNNNADYYSTQSEIAMPSSDFSITADFKPIENAVDSGYTPVRINEISAANEIFVNEYSKKGDWVELYNTTCEPQDVEGMYITDDTGNLQKCTLTKGDASMSTSIPAHGYMVVWCDKRSSLSDLHASFKLNDDGGCIALSAKDMSWTDSLSYPAHDGWHTIGRYIDGGKDIYIMDVPTIGKKNMLSSYNEFVQTQTSTGIESVEYASPVSALDMNYASGRLIIRGKADMATIDIYTLSGQHVTNATVGMSNGMGVVTASQLNSGCYVAKASDSRGNHTTCKFIK